MKLTVLMDNNTLIDRYFYGEPAVSYLIETEGEKVLFDTGYSGAFIMNARKLDMDLLDIDYLVLSHGHIDHTGGLEPLLKLFMEKSLRASADKPELIAHPSVFSRKFFHKGPEIGSLVQKDSLLPFFTMKLSKKPVVLSKNLLFLGEIDRKNSFESRVPVGKTMREGTAVDDFVPDDSALVYTSGEGLVIITGCSHSGICNIIAAAQKATGIKRIADIIGGFHLLDPPEEQLEETAAYLDKAGPKTLHACHCTDLQSKIRLSAVSDLKEVGSGLVLEYSDR